MPTKKQIITIGVLGVIALGLGYWYGGSDRYKKSYYEYEIIVGGIFGPLWVACIILILYYPIKTTRYPNPFFWLSHVLSVGMGYTATWIFVFVYLFAIKDRTFERTLREMSSSDSALITAVAFGIVYVLFAGICLISFVLDKPISNILKHVRSAKTKCKWCKETIKADALICKHCGVRFEERETTLIPPRESP